MQRAATHMCERLRACAQVCDVDQLEEVVEHRLGCAPNMKYFYQPAQRTYIGSPHQYNCTYFSALHGNPRHYLLARAIQFFTPGLPMVYYVGLLAGRNDHEVRSQQQDLFLSRLRLLIWCRKLVKRRRSLQAVTD